MKIIPIEVEYIENGTFQGGEEDCFDAKIHEGDECVVLSIDHYNVLMKALKKISEFDGEPIWDDDRDDAANIMRDIAADAIKGKYSYDEDED